MNGYELLYEHGAALVNWVRRVRPEHLVFDPGPPIAQIDPGTLDTILAATRWLSLSAAEAQSLTGEQDPAAAAAAALPRIGGAADGAWGGVVVQAGAEGCVVPARGGEPMAVPAFAAEVLDTTGARDTEVGAFIAALARGLDPVEACRWGNAAASVVVASRGQVSPPRLAELRELIGTVNGDDDF